MRFRALPFLCINIAYFYIIKYKGCLMNSLIAKRVMEEAKYMLDTKETIRQLALVFKISKSTVHKDLHERLLEIDYDLYKQIDSILKYHIDIRHIRGGESTKNRYKQQYR